MKQRAATPQDYSPQDRIERRIERRPERRPENRLCRRGGSVELLRLPAAFFGAAARLRSALYDRRLLPIQELAIPVVSVGNLTTGGTGKTPMVAWVVRALARRGLRGGILSRGYGEKSDPAGESGDSLNDEGRMLAQILPDVPHVQDKNRVRGGSRLVEQGVDVIVLDDGFQHRRLHRDVDLVLVDATRPWGLSAPPQGGEPVRALLPRGLLREPPAALARADAIVITRSDSVSEDVLDALTCVLQDIAPGRPIARACHVPTRLREAGGADVGLEFLAGREVDLVSGVGNPEAFEATVRALGATVSEHRSFPDHHDYGPEDLAGLSGLSDLRGHGQRPVITTAKDAVKLEAHPSPLHVLDVELEVVSGESVLHALFEALPESQRIVERRAFHEGLHG